MNTSSNRNVIKNNKFNDIKSVTLMGVTNQCVDFKLHAILNYQENIYANVYPFFVTHNNGTSCTIQTYDDIEVDYLMKFVNNKDAVMSKTGDNIMNESEILDNLTKLKELHDSGIIPDDMFEEKKKHFLDMLNSGSNNQQISQKETRTVSFIRKKKRPLGEGKTSLYINGELVKDDIDNQFSVALPLGSYTLMSKRGVLTGKLPIYLTLESTDMTVCINPQAFSIVLEIIS